MSTDTDAPISENDNPTLDDTGDALPGHDFIQDVTAVTIPDNSGFDPAIHATGPDGQPKRRGDGSFALRRGRKPGSKTGTAPASTPTLDAGATVEPGTADAPEAPASMSNREAARQVCNLAIGAATALIGPEWAPTSKEEANNLSTAVKNYFDARGQVQLSPEWGLVFAVVAYSAPRFAHENTASKFSRAVNWCKKKYLDLRLKFKRVI